MPDPGQALSEMHRVPGARWPGGRVARTMGEAEQPKVGAIEISGAVEFSDEGAPSGAPGEIVIG